ncbi:hypothetical protein LEP1GSC043_3471 [Leptospira weilii str. Ecochallenge]|uniref:Uncharacterized protein n=1 Tax=Leptospira weilii str. Ecochallenge TaxID=1049986 RepID=N1U3E8_9LEPT|nr:hypothetical protein LEP1GSC043_3471 [Leptospira weilii str. Ecochallenge]
MRKEQFNFENQDLYRKICGINDEGVKILEKQLEMDIIPRGNGFQIEGESAKVEFALDFLKNSRPIIANVRTGILSIHSILLIFLRMQVRNFAKRKREKTNRSEVLPGNRVTKFSRHIGGNIFFPELEIRKFILDLFRRI